MDIRHTPLAARLFRRRWLRPVPADAVVALRLFAGLGSRAEIWRMKATRRLALALLVILPAAAHAQRGNGTGPSSRAPWHTSTRLRDTVRSGSYDPAMVLRYVEAELALGRADHAR